MRIGRAWLPRPWSPPTLAEHEHRQGSRQWAPGVHRAGRASIGTVRADRRDPRGPPISARLRGGMIGTSLANRYRIDALLGRGGMGSVYRAHDLTLGRDVAIKVVEGRLDSGWRQRLLHEARSAAALNHPHIVAVHDAGEAAGEPFVVMELVTGGSLRSHGVLSLPQVITVARQLCDALAHAHEKGIVHRDLKPENVLVGNGEHEIDVKLADLGLAFVNRDTR